MILVKCDRCGAEEETGDVTAGVPGGTLPGVFRKVVLPDAWQRAKVPAEDGSAWEKHLCPKCVNALRQFFQGDGAVDGLLSPSMLARAEETEHTHNFDRLHGLCRCGSTYQDVLDRHPLREAGLNAIPAQGSGAAAVDRVMNEAVTDPGQLGQALWPDPERFASCPFCPGVSKHTDLNEHIRLQHEDRWPEWAELAGVDKRPQGCIAHGGPDCICDDQDGYTGQMEDSRPNLTARAELISSGKRCTCAGVGFGTEDCTMHHPDGVQAGTHLPCTYGQNAGECPGIFRRGLFHEHMGRWHGIKVHPSSEPCPYCSDIHPGSRLGEHIAKDHPGEWSAWEAKRGR